MTVKNIFSLSAALAVLGVIVYILISYPVAEKLLECVAWIDSMGNLGILIFMVVFSIGVIIFLPASVMSLGAGFAYGIVLGSILVTIGGMIGAVVAFLLSRYIARDWVTKIIARDRRFQRVDKAIAANGFKFVLLTRLSPVVPYVLQNYTYGLTAVSLKDYSKASVIGMLPGTLLYVYLGSMITEASQVASGKILTTPAHIAFYILGLIATVAITIVLAKIAKKAMQEENSRNGNSTGV